MSKQILPLPASVTICDKTWSRSLNLPSPLPHERRMVLPSYGIELFSGTVGIRRVKACWGLQRPAGPVAASWRPCSLSHLAPSLQNCSSSSHSPALQLFDAIIHSLATCPVIYGTGLDRWDGQKGQMREESDVMEKGRSRPARWPVSHPPAQHGPRGQIPSLGWLGYACLFCGLEWS